MKKRLLRAVAVAAALVLFSSFSPARALGLSAEHAILMDAGSGRVLYEKNADSRSLIASTTKIMTALVICEQCNVLDRVQIMPEAVGIEGSSMYLQAGEVLTVQELLYGLMLQSGNDAAVALAIYCGGTVEGFAQLMNDEARRIGLTGTHFENPNGLDHENHYSTARDLAKLTAYAMENEIFAKTVSTKSIQVGGRSLTNHNKLLWRYEGADGVKTGYTKAAGRILVSSATRDGRQLIAVTINAQAVVVGLCFANGLSPITGKYGWPFGILAGMLHFCLVTSVPLLHGGFCLYNGGFTAAFVCLALVPQLERFCKTREERRAARVR